MTAQHSTGWWIQIGADPQSSAILERARARGLETLVFDSNPAAPAARFATRLMTRAADDADAIRTDLRALARSERIVGCDTTSREHTALRTVAAIRDDHELPGLSAERTQLLTTRAAWKKVLADAGIATPVVAILESPLELDRFLGVHPSALLRPATGGRGSTGVSCVRIGDPRNRELFDEARLVSDSDLVRAEAFVAGDEYSIDGIVRDGRFELLHVGRQFSMRNLRGTLPTGTAWGSPGQGRRADEDPRWETSIRLGQRVADVLAVDDTFLHLGVMDDGETDHVIDVRPHPGLAIDPALEFAGIDPADLRVDLALGSPSDETIDPGAITFGFAQRFFYANAQGRIETPGAGPDAGGDDPIAAGRHWRTVALTHETVRLEWDRRPGDEVERPRSHEDRVARALVEADDRNAAWMRANEIDADSVFQVRETRREPPMTTRPPLWPMTPDRT